MEIVFAAFVLIACAAYYLLAPRLYESTAVFSIGHFMEISGAEKTAIEDPRVLIQRLRLMPGVVSVKSDPGNGKRITVTVQAGTDEQARNVLQGIVDGVFSSHDQIFKGVMERNRGLLKEDQLRLEAVRKELAFSDAQLADFSTADDPVLSAVRRLERVTLLQLQHSQEQLATRMESIMKRPNAEETQLNQPVLVSPRPVRPSLFIAFYLPMIVLGVGVGVKVLWKLR